MKYLKNICNTIGIILLFLNIIFAYIWKSGYYYFLDMLVCIALSYLILFFVKYIHDIHENKRANSKLKKSLSQKSILLAKLDVEEKENLSKKYNRSFEYVFSQIYDLLSDENKTTLRQEVNFWSPESLFNNLSLFINRNVLKDSENPNSVKVYAILCNKSEDEIRQMFMNISKKQGSVFN